MIIVLFSLAASGDFYTWYISPKGSMSNKGTEESPYAMNVDAINKNMKRIGYSSNFRLILMEGDYHIPGNYGLSFSDKITGSINSIHITSQEGKRVRFIGGQLFKNWTQSLIYPHLWTTSLNVQISDLFINDKRATVSRVPKIHQKARTLYFTKYNDPDDSNYEIRKYWVQHDCIDLLSKLPEDELHKARITDFHGGRWNRDSIYQIDTKNDIIYTRILKSSIINFGVYPIKSNDMYFIDNIFPVLTNPGEWYQFPNGTIYYYPENDDKIENSESYFSDQGIGIHTSKKHNILIENIEFYYMNGHGFYISEAGNVTVRNVTVKHCANGFSTNGYNGTIEDSLFEDIGGYAGRFHSTKNVTLRNCIMRRLTRTTYDTGGIYIAVNNKDLKILNNDISGSYSAPIFASGNSKYDLETVKNITIKDNHIHHAGLNVMDDFGGVQGLALPNGLIIDHNWIHDMNAAKSIGNGMFVGTGIAGVIMKNNLVHDISHDAMKMDHGVNITLHNNILAYSNYMMTWTKYVENTFTFNIDNNIFDNQYIYVMTGPWANSDSKYYINKNIYWHQSDTSKLSWVYKTFDDWKKIGNDLESFVTDPLFVNADKRDFNFKSEDAYKKIGFKPFSMTFGVIGEKWREIADNFKQEEPYGTPLNSPIKGSYGFEEGEDENIVKIVTTINKAEISTDKKYGNEGKNSLKLQSTGGKKIDKDRPNMATTLNWNEGIGEFSLMVFMDEGTRIHFDMNFGKKFIIENIKMTYDTTEIGEVPSNEWFELKFAAGYGNDNDGTFNVSVNGHKPVIIKATYKNTPQALFEVVNSTSNIYVDNINAKFNCKSLDYFEEFAKNEDEIFTSSINNENTKNDENDKITTTDGGNNDADKITVTDGENSDDDKISDNGDDESSSDGNKNKDENDSNNNNSKKKKTTIIAVVVVVVVVVAAVIGIVLYFTIKKRKDEDSEILELNE